MDSACGRVIVCGPDTEFDKIEIFAAAARFWFVSICIVVDGGKLCEQISKVEAAIAVDVQFHFCSMYIYRQFLRL